MRKITKLMLTLALLVAGVGVANATKYYADLSGASGVGNATWTAGTNTFAWTADSYAYLVVPGGSFSGDLSEYTTIGLDVSGLVNEFRVDILANGKTFTGKSIATDGNVVLDILSDFNLQWNPDKITVEDLKSVEAIRLNTNSASGSAVVTKFYIAKPTSLSFDKNGTGSLNSTDLVATGGLSFNSETGELTSDGTAGELKLEFVTPVDLKNLFHFNVTHSGSTNDILSRLEFYDEDDVKINTWNSIKLSNTWNPSGIDDNATNAFLNHKPVKKMVWPSDANASNNGKTATITSISFTCKTIACAKAGETVLKSLPYQDMSGTSATPTWNVSTSTDTYYGTTDGTNAVSYSDVTAYSELRIYRDDNTGFRAFFIDAAGSKVTTINHENEASSWIPEGKYWSIDLSKVEQYEGKVALQGIKSAGWGQNNIVNNIVLYQTPAANAPKYSLSGSGMQLEETVAALADATATCIDATGVTGITTNSEAGRTLLTSANPNCLFLGTSGIGALANTQNVVTGGTCANLVLTDGHPFKAPADFTATTASYTTTINAEAGAGTLCLPFAATIPAGVTAYTLTYTSGDKATATAVETTIPANTPVLLNGSGETTFTGSGAVVAEAANTAGNMTGVFASVAVPTGSYVLQNGDDGVGFYNVTTNDITINPFRAYLTASAGVHSLTVDYQNGEETGIEEMRNGENEKMRSEIFDLSGRRVVKAQKGIYIVNGKKIVK